LSVFGRVFVSRFGDHAAAHFHFGDASAGHAFREEDFVDEPGLSFSGSAIKPIKANSE
jgi:hypothetical protein